MANYYQPYNPYPQTQTMQIQNGGFVSVRNEMEARNYPVAFGNSITFKDENAPYVYTKTMGFSQLETPKFEKYRLIKEEEALPDVSESPVSNVTVQDDNLSIDEIKSEIGQIKSDIRDIRKQLEKPIKKSKQEDN